jgi:hypothetical protein
MVAIVRTQLYIMKNEEIKSNKNFVLYSFSFRWFVNFSSRLRSSLLTYYLIGVHVIDQSEHYSNNKSEKQKGR